MSPPPSGSDTKSSKKQSESTWEAELSSKTPIDFSRTTRRYIPGERTLLTGFSSGTDIFLPLPFQLLKLHRTLDLIARCDAVWSGKLLPDNTVSHLCLKLNSVRQENCVPAGQFVWKVTVRRLANNPRPFTAPNSLQLRHKETKSTAVRTGSQKICRSNPSKHHQL